MIMPRALVVGRMTPLLTLVVLGRVALAIMTGVLVLTVTRVVGGLDAIGYRAPRRAVPVLGVLGRLAPLQNQRHGEHEQNPLHDLATCGRTRSSDVWQSPRPSIDDSFLRGPCSPSTTT